MENKKPTVIVNKAYDETGHVFYDRDNLTDEQLDKIIDDVFDNIKLFPDMEED